MQKSSKPKNQTSIGIPIRTYTIVKKLAEHGHRKLSQQIEILAIEECNRQGIEIPAELEGA